VRTTDELKGLARKADEVADELRTGIISCFDNSSELSIVLATQILGSQDSPEQAVPIFRQESSCGRQQTTFEHSHLRTALSTSLLIALPSTTASRLRDVRSLWFLCIYFIHMGLLAAGH
jgi:hypothetical protein